jgi:hypothetical protein
MRNFDLAIAWNWEFDADYVHGIERECHARHISTYQITPSHLHSVLEHLRAGKIRFRAFYDRASDADEAYLPLVQALDPASVWVINPHDRVVHAIDKATMHLEFITHGLQVPTTIILSPFNKNNHLEIRQEDLRKLSSPFVVKPANTTGGGTGVVLDAKTVDDVTRARQVHCDDKYLLQEFIHPTDLDGKRGWFRVYSVFGECIPCWWDDITHEYSELSAEEEREFDLSGLRTVMSAIRGICGLDFFSSEIALSAGKFIVVDYVNEICDMRLKSRFHNGAPDAVVHRIESLIADEAEKHVSAAVTGERK